MSKNDNVVYIKLSNHDAKVSIYEKDYKELISFGISPKWFYHQNNVWVRHNRRKLAITRLLLDAGPGQTVKQIDKNPLNLKGDNLLLVSYGPGTSKYRTRDFI